MWRRASFTLALASSGAGNGPWLVRPLRSYSYRQLRGATNPVHGQTSRLTGVRPQGPTPLGSLDRRKIAALVGVAPINRDSGTFRGRRMIMGGRASVRTALYMPTLTAIRHNPALQALYQRLIGRGRPAKVAITACMRKLLVILNERLGGGARHRSRRRLDGLGKAGDRL
jgi:transposase